MCKSTFTHSKQFKNIYDWIINVMVTLTPIIVTHVNEIIYLMLLSSFTYVKLKIIKYSNVNLYIFLFGILQSLKVWICICSDNI